MDLREGRFSPVRRQALCTALVLSIGALGLSAAPAYAAGDVVVGVILPLSGAFADQGSHYETGMRLYQELNGTKAGGKDVKLVVKDDQGPGSGDLARRLTQELIARDKAELIVGYSFTPNAMAAASILTQAKTPAIIVNAMTSVLTEKSPYYTRISGTMPMVAYTQGKWAAAQGKKTAYVIVSDYAPGIDAETWFIKGFESGGGKVVGKDRTPLSAMEYGPYLQRAIEAKPEVVFGFNPGGDVSIAFVKQAGTRLKGTGIQLMVTGDVVDDNLLPAMGDAAEGVISAWHYQAEIDNPANKTFLKAFQAKQGAGKLPSYRVMQGYDAMAMVYKALNKTGGTTGDAFMEAVKGMEIDSPRGPIRIDPATREIVENIYIRRGVMSQGVAVNKPIATVEAVKDPAKQ
ncbi:ABC transporter substrate-binding protein [Variovorax sp. Sphag1AA]|uniref:ABC transporter substrate-binding protein n=1 Tax=Variovorax sp. Sphag1AA TaxID=2587027 RepID=UPI001618A566|nr:ABC transporter substrate-binding protein [Variovorax sp. Sphag1AA]MBB3178592.1 branched-chain amino acid transport system substrate-binding protein [Variovorax sp. Sphag1AA]